ATQRHDVKLACILTAAGLLRQQCVRRCDDRRGGNQQACAVGNRADPEMASHFCSTLTRNSGYIDAAPARSASGGMRIFCAGSLMNGFFPGMWAGTTPF